MGLVKTKLNDLIKDADKVAVGENVWELFAVAAATQHAEIETGAN